MFYYSQVPNTPAMSLNTSQSNNNNNNFKPNYQQSPASITYPNMCSSPYLGSRLTSSNYNDSVYSSGYSSANNSSSYNQSMMFQNSSPFTPLSLNYNFMNKTVSDIKIIKRLK